MGKRIKGGGWFPHPCRSPACSGNLILTLFMFSLMVCGYLYVFASWSF